MGYYTVISGEIAISPHIPWDELKTSPFVEGGATEYVEKDVALRVVEKVTETDEGTLTVRYADAVIPAGDDSVKAYGIVEHLQELIKLHGEGRAFTGRLDGEGEDAGDLWRLEVHDGKAVKVRPRIVWPDGTEEPQR